MEADKLAPFNPTSEETQNIAIDMLELTSDDVLFDLGCGDARLLTAAVQRISGLHCVGIEIDDELVARAKQNVETNLSLVDRSRIKIRKQNLLENDVWSMDKNGEHEASCRSIGLEDASAIYLYLLPKGLVKIKPLLDRLVERRRLRGKGLKVVAYMFKVHGWEPSKINDNTKGNIRLYLYEFPFGDSTTS